METTQTKTAAKQIMKELIYFASSAAGNWGKGYNIETAKKNANISSKKTKYILWAAIFETFESPEDKKNIMDCIIGNIFTGVPEFYKDGRTTEDNDMINKYLIGWTVIENKSL